MTEHLHPDTGIVHDHDVDDLRRHRHDPYAGYRRLAEAVLIAHQRRDDSNCLCGRLRLGDSWAEHVAEILDVAGALRDRPPRSRAGAALRRSVQDVADALREDPEA